MAAGGEAGVAGGTPVVGAAGWTLAILGLAGSGAAIGGKLMLERSNVHQLDGCQKQLSVLQLQVQQTKGDRDAIDAAMRATDGQLIAVNATGCLEVFSTPYPETSWQLPWIHSLFGNAAAVATGVAAALKVKARAAGQVHSPVRVIAQGGDGGREVGAHEVELVADVAIRGVGGKLGRRQGEDQPALAGVDRPGLAAKVPTPTDDFVLMDAGANLYLPKPIAPTRLIQLVQEALRG